MGLALCTKQVYTAHSKPKEMLCINTLYRYIPHDENSFEIYDIKTYQKVLISIDRKEFEDYFTPLISIDEAMKIIMDTFKSIGVSVELHKTKFVTGSYCYNSYDEKEDFYIKFPLSPGLMIYSSERGAYIDTLYSRDYICDSISVDIISNSKLNGRSFIRGLIPSEIQELAETLNFLLT